MTKKKQVLEVARNWRNRYIKLASTLIVHKTPSKFRSYNFKLRFKPSIFVRKPFLSGFEKQPCRTRRVPF
jgi:hypothetical protein